MKRTILNLTIAVTFIMIACDGPIGPIGLKSLMSISNEPGGSNCQYGGLKIEAGIDENKNDLLESNEVDNTNYVCNGQPGSNASKSLIKVTSEQFGTNCPTGGYRLDSGIDLNGNDILDPNEVQSTTYLCNGLNGTKSLMTITTEGHGINCSSGGYKVDSGLDVNNNNVLDGVEVSSTKFICNGKDGEGFDKVTVLDFGYNAGTTSSDWTIAQFDPALNLYKFNIDNYPGVDSVVFVAFLGTGNVNSKCFVELYNLTDNASINNSILESNRLIPGPYPPPYEIKQTGNIYTQLPHKEVTLTFRIKSEIPGVQAFAGTGCYLYLYKR